MADHPQKDRFHKHDKSGEFIVTVEVRGLVSIRLSASSIEDARNVGRDRADTMLEQAEDGTMPDLDDVESIELHHVSQCPDMYSVRRDGKDMQVSSLELNDVPRDLDKRGF